MKKIAFSFLELLFVITLLAGCGSKTAPQSPVALTWEQVEKDSASNLWRYVFTLTNISQKELPADWAIYYSVLPKRVVQADDTNVRISDINGNFYRMTPTEHFVAPKPGESVTIEYRSTYVDRTYRVPEGTYWVETIDGKEQQPVDVEITIKPFPGIENIKEYPDASIIYDANLRVEKRPVINSYDILPAVKQATPAGGEALVLDGSVALTYDEAFASEAALLKANLEGLYGLTVVPEAPVTIALGKLTDTSKAPNDEYYTLLIKENRIDLQGASAHGVFNATQSLLAMLKGQAAPYRLAPVVIADYPDMPYRGLMLDIVRNYTTFEHMKEMVDLMASYKLSVLHFHFNDDEAWRLEIPGLEELTTIASRRGHTHDESQSLYPGFGGSYDPNAATPANGYYTRDQFIELLKYAAERHITVLPEIETPGHARAAIVAMKARYNKYKDTDMEKATEYMLHEEADTSKYRSVQSYPGNVVNVALPSTYRFIEKVSLEIQKMYQEAGVELPAIHLGGDEVARGAWVGSPACQALMKEKGMTKRHDLAEYYITKMSGILASHGIKSAGWQEVGLGYSDEADKQLTSELYSVNCWTGQESFGQLYNVANKGYPVVVSCVCNFYMDMTYSHHPFEPLGLDWGGIVDEAISFSAQPYNIFRSLRQDGMGRLLDMDNLKPATVALTEKGRQNLLGVSGQFFAETLRSYDMLQYTLLPKMMGLVERGWNAHPAWGELRGQAEANAFNADLARYYGVISTKEMPSWAKEDINFRLPMPGVKIVEGVMYANLPITGAEIRYTLDGSEPTAQSALYTEPVAVNPESTIRVKTFYQGKESLGLKVKR